MENQKGNTNVIVSFVIVLIVVGLVVYALMYKTKVASESKIDQNVTTEESLPGGETQLPDNKTEEKSMDTNNTNKRLLPNFKPVSNVSKLEKIDLVVGTGEEVKAGATVSVHYTGAVAATGEVFQSSKDFGTTPITFPLSGVIKGWTDGIPGMKVGGTRRLVIPAAQAYGATPPPGSGIPANADLVFDVELVSVQ